MFICCKYCRSPTSWGNSPWKLLFLRLSLVRNVRFPIDGGRVPDKQFCESVTNVTTLSLCKINEQKSSYWHKEQNTENSIHSYVWPNNQPQIPLILNQSVINSSFLKWKFMCISYHIYHSWGKNTYPILQNNPVTPNPLLFELHCSRANEQMLYTKF